MNSQPLNYTRPDTAPPRRNWFNRLLIAFILLLIPAFLASLSITFRRDQARIDTVTGSMTRQTFWPFGLTTGPRPDVSPLETRLKKNGIRFTPSWQLLHNTHRNIFGRATCRECNLAPPIFHLRPMLKEFTTASTDQELQEFIRIMQSGTEQEQKAAIDAATEKALQSRPTPPPPR